jgi:hypothetical protein
MDLNDGFGSGSTEDQRHIGLLNAKQERYAGEQLRAFCKESHVAIINTLQGGHDTYFGKWTTSRSDYIGTLRGRHAK